MFKTVIWATDGSEDADRAMTPAVALATAEGAELHVVHIVEKLVSGRAGGLDTFADEPELKAKVERQARRIGRRDGLAVRVHLLAARDTRVGDRIVEIATDVGADVIVVGTRGRGAVGTFVLGSVTQRLLHVSHCPVLAIPRGVPARTEQPEPAATAG